MKNIKDKILYIIIIILMAMMITIAIVSNNFYSQVAMITEVDEESNFVTATCSNGNMFSFYDTSEDWVCGDLCSMIMYDSGTKIVYDDKVISARYGGFTRLFEEIEATLEGEF